MKRVKFDTKDGNEYVNHFQLRKLEAEWDLIVISDFMPSCHEYEYEPVARLFYKGNDMDEAKTEWRTPATGLDSNLEKILIFRTFQIRTQYMHILDVSDVEGECSPLVYPITLFDCPPTRYKSTPESYYNLTNVLKTDWLVFTVYDIDLYQESYVGEVFVKTKTKKEAIKQWEKLHRKDSDFDRGIYRYNLLYNIEMTPLW